MVFMGQGSCIEERLRCTVFLTVIPRLDLESRHQDVEAEFKTGIDILTQKVLLNSCVKISVGQAFLK